MSHLFTGARDYGGEQELFPLYLRVGWLDFERDFELMML